MQAGRPPSPGGPTPSKTSSHASFSRRTSASGVAPAGPAATPGPASSEIQPSRSVSEDSDSEGGTLFQPVQFREHVQVSQHPCCCPHLVGHVLLVLAACGCADVCLSVCMHACCSSTVGVVCEGDMGSWVPHIQHEKACGGDKL